MEWSYLEEDGRELFILIRKLNTAFDQAYLLAKETKKAKAEETRRKKKESAAGSKAKVLAGSSQGIGVLANKPNIEEMQIPFSSNESEPLKLFVTNPGHGGWNPE